MSKVHKMIELEPPGFDLRKELLVSPGHRCGYCKGNGWFWDTDPHGEDIQKPCPACGGSGEMDAVVTIEWKPSKAK